MTRNLNSVNILLFIFMFFWLAPCQTYGQKLKINLFNAEHLRSFVFSVIEGKYKVFTKKSCVLTIDEYNVLYITQENDSIVLRDANRVIGKYDSIALRGITKTCSFKLKPVNPALLTVIYDDDLVVRSFNGHLQLINDVFIEHYIAGVVVAEGGYNRPLEFYKSQAVIGRTFALKHLYRHINEGFHLCDDVHCQVYKGVCTEETVFEAVRMTNGLVLVDSDSVLITAAFHSNSGGQTQNSENVWLKPKPYLQSIEDRFAVHGRNAFWSETIPIDDWKNYLADNGIDVERLRNRDLLFEQEKRKKYYVIKNDSVPLRKIRADWGFKSSFFSINKKGGSLLFSGKGYGHGVGLSQEGAIYMAGIGYDYQEIINFYYKDVNMLDYFELGIIDRIKEKKEVPQ